MELSHETWQVVDNYGANPCMGKMLCVLVFFYALIALAEKGGRRWIVMYSDGIIIL